MHAILVMNDKRTIHAGIAVYDMLACCEDNLLRYGWRYTFIAIVRGTLCIQCNVCVRVCMCVKEEDRHIPLQHA